MKKKIAVFTGAGMSADSGLRTFRDSGGLWESYRIEDVATPDAWRKNPELVLRFYNERYAQLQQALPNDAHRALVRLNSLFDMQIITQNVDDLHERAGSEKVLHLHGELTKCRSTVYESEVYPMPEGGLAVGDVCKYGSQLRPHIVWFGEPVPAMPVAEEIVAGADILLVIGTSLNVYPAAGLLYFTMPEAKIIFADLAEPAETWIKRVEYHKGRAAITVPAIVNNLMNQT